MRTEFIQETTCENPSTLKIEPELKTLLPPLTQAEQAALEKDILAHGVMTPLVVWNGILIDGHHRYQICTKNDLPFPICEIEFETLDAAKFWAWQHQEARRNLSAYQRAEVALKFKPLIAAQAKERKLSTLKQNSDPATLPEREERKETREELAEIAKVGSRTLDKAEFITDHADEKTKQKLRAGDTTINAEYKRLKKEIDKHDRDLKKQAQIVIPTDDRVRLITASVTDAIGHVESESVDFIVTDPPYPKEYLPIYDDLATFAQHALKPGGSLLCMVGQSYLPEIVQKLNEKLDYHWTLAYLTPGGQATQLWERKVNTFWKPVLWFTKGAYKGDWIGDVTNSKTNDNDKRHHHWGQSESGMRDLMERFVYPNMTVCDPFLGGGTTGQVALVLGCRFIGFDIDEECVAKTQVRMSKSLMEGGQA